MRKPAMHACLAMSGVADVDFHTARVLLVEDNPIHQELARALLEAAGCRVTIAVNGRMAVTQWMAQDFALVLMNCRMPGHDGIEATGKMRALEAGSCARIPIVALTAKATSSDRERCIAAGMDDYLTTPLSRSDLMRVLRQWIAHTNRPAVSAMPQSPVEESRANTPVERVRHRPMRKPAAFDNAALQNTLPAGVGMDSPFVYKLIQLFVNEASRLIMEIECAAAADDAQMLMLAANSLKSSAAAIGAYALADIAKTLEAMARAGQTGALADHPACLRLAYERFCEDSAICGMLASDSVARNAA